MITAKLASAAALVLAGFLFQGSDTAARAQSGEARTLAFDVAIDVKTLSLNNNDPAAKGNPLRGSTFIVYGKIFPAERSPPGSARSIQIKPAALGRGSAAAFSSPTTPIFSRPRRHNWPSRLPSFSSFQPTK